MEGEQVNTILIVLGGIAGCLLYIGVVLLATGAYKNPGKGDNDA